MPNSTIEPPDWLRETGTILEELNEGIVVVDDQRRVIFANEALRRMGHFEREEIQGRTLRRDFPTRRYSAHYAAARIGAPVWPESRRILPSVQGRAQNPGDFWEDHSRSRRNGLERIEEFQPVPKQMIRHARKRGHCDLENQRPKQ